MGKRCELFGEQLGWIKNREKFNAFNLRLFHELSTMIFLMCINKIKVLIKKIEVIHNFSKTNNNNKIKYLLLKTQKMVVDK